MEIIEGQPCPVCNNKTALTLTQDETEVPFFGKVFLFSMDCKACKYHKADVESAEQREGTSYTIEIQGKQDMNIRVVRSSEATINLPHVGTLEPGENAEGFVTNIEGIIERFKKQIERLRDSAEEEDKKKAKNLLKKLQNVLWGEEKLTITIKDPSGNSAIVSDKAKITKLK
ncbi:ZPR1 zinc finger domain-containing protein [Candidatus Woesearchaeota archaeon]|nr:ZPR1 zinc finger domain-containing protein [Candidatus Woesearchaeota archaeon]